MEEYDKNALTSFDLLNIFKQEQVDADLKKWKTMLLKIRALIKLPITRNRVMSLFHVTLCLYPLYFSNAVWNHVVKTASDPIIEKQEINRQKYILVPREVFSIWSLYFNFFRLSLCIFNLFSIIHLVSSPLEICLRDKRKLLTWVSFKNNKK